jgi:hypothetical protein
MQLLQLVQHSGRIHRQLWKTPLPSSAAVDVTLNTL